MYGLTRGPITLLSAGIAGFLVWLATQFNSHHTGGYWAAMLVIAGAGLVMALAQLIGGWTKWGWPRISASVLFFAFVPSFICVAWLLVAGQPHANTTQSHVASWSGDIGLGGVVRDLIQYIGVFAFGLGLILGFSFDTTGPRTSAPSPELKDWETTIERDRPAAVTTTTSTATVDGTGVAHREPAAVSTDGADAETHVVRTGGEP
jgi:hypothetical protein